ncbi:YkoP family protein [Fictibacillus gelatini]|uniref:YkoP family protein n=1 Tax=Fictibacillus gelatini TaxID=225985 RepID=UPI000479F622|nr:hypothetical protein [Fictibacillus gelatini]
MNVRLYFLSIWSLLDPIYFVLTRLTYIDQEKKNIFRVRLTKYKGRDVILSDGSRIVKNDLLIKIHLHNARLLKEIKLLSNPLSKGKLIHKLIYDSMPELAKYINNHSLEKEIKGIIGITMINKGFRALGFECFSPVSRIYKWFKFITQLPIFLLSTSHFSIKNFHKHSPIYLVMSKDQLLNKYYRPTGNSQ